MYAQKKCKWKIILIAYEIMNMIWSEQNYGARLYQKLMFNKLKVMRRSFFNNVLQT
jgi:hypothetical protein